MRRALLILVAVALPAAAQGPRPAEADDAARKRTAALLKGMTFDPDLLGTLSFGMYHRQKRLGSLVVGLSKAPDGSGAVYSLSARGTFRVGPQMMSYTEKALLDASLGVLRREGTYEGLERPIGRVKRTKALVRKGDQWHHSATYADAKGNTKKAELTAPARGRNHWDLNALMFLVPRLRFLRGRHVLQGVRWPKLLPTGWAGDGKPAHVPVVIEVPKLGVIPGLGKAIHQGVRIKVTRGEEAPGFLSVDAEGFFRALEKQGVPVRVLLEPPKVGPNDVSEVRAAVGAYLSAAAGKTTLEELDKVVDWTALARAKHDDAALNGKTPAELRERLGTMFSESPAPAPTTKLARHAKVTIVGPAAVVELATSFANVLEVRLRKRKDGWRLVTLTRSRYPQER